MRIEYGRNVVKYINSTDKHTNSIPEDASLPEEIEAIKKAKEDISKFGTIPHGQVDWD